MITGMAADYGRTMAEQNVAVQDNIREALQSTGERISYSTLVMIGVVIFIAIWMASILTRKLTDMIKGIRLFQAGDMEHRLAVDSGDELGQLARTFNEMSDNIQQLITDLRQAEQNYRGFFENATEGIFRTSPDGRLINVNAAFAKLFGFDSPEVMLREVRHIGEEFYVDPRRREELIAIMEEAGKVRNFEHEIKRRDGGVRILQLSCYWVTGEDGQRYLEGMSTDITERKMALQALREAKDKAEQLSQMKSSFLSMVSHELRTPLTSIIGFAKLIRKYLSEVGEVGDYSDSAKKKLDRMDGNMSVIISEGNRLTELVNNVLDLAKLEAGYFEWHFELVSIGEILEHSFASTKVLFDAAKIKFEMDVDPELPLVSGDRNRLVQVCINLLANAVKFTGEGEVTCRARVEGPEVVVSVADTGVGVSPEEVEVIFDKFRQLGDTLTDKPKGTGLGLPICREIVEHHGGRIWHEPNPGGGSIFAFTVPLDWAAGNRRPEDNSGRA